ncbi:MAG: intradiol ring-cleavage dioxygenase [Gammaproteobacteria bacterium]|nr:MAG: intradiol ring-cleavage dioxygenase [Gammaproteobacteria bacterium]
MSRYTGFLATLLLFTSTTFAEEKQCAPTPQQFLGNSYIPNAAKPAQDVGKGLVMQGHVLSSATCEPIADAVIERWQAGNNGTYEMHLRAYMKPQPDGSYRFETEWPNMSIPHIHFIVTADGYNKLTTQWIPDSKVSEAKFDLVLEPKF